MRALYVFIAFAMLPNVICAAEDSSGESQAIEKIELLGGKVTMDEKLPRRPVICVDFRESKQFSDKYASRVKSTVTEASWIWIHLIQKRSIFHSGWSPINTSEPICHVRAYIY